MPDLRRFSFFAVLFVVLLRMAIGWQFFYEGLWKYDSLETAKPWTSAGYLKNSQGPLRPMFRDMVEDPNDWEWLQFDVVSERWTNWQSHFATFYDLGERQKARLQREIDGPEKVVGRKKIPATAAEIEAAGIKIGGPMAQRKIIQIVEVKKDNGCYLVVNGRLRFLPAERRGLLREGKKAENNAKKLLDVATKNNDAKAIAVAKKHLNIAQVFQQAVEDVYIRNTRLGYRQQLAAMLKGDDERGSLIAMSEGGDSGYTATGKVKEYLDRTEEYERLLADAKIDFEHRHLSKKQQHIRTLYAELVVPVKQLEEKMKEQMQQILTEEQREKGRLPKMNMRRIDQIDMATMWGLMILGGLLIIGLFSRLASFAGAGLILSFYLVMPPWPGVPAAPGPEHSLIVNKNLLELLALLLLAAIPSGKWFGLDALFQWFIHGGKKPKSNKKKQKQQAEKQPAKQQPVTPQPATPPVDQQVDPTKTYPIKQPPNTKKSKKKK